MKTLERLILYYNAIPSLEELKALYGLPALRELDLRLNPLTKTHPHYRPYIVHAMPTLRQLDGCPIRDTERKAAIMKFSADDLPQQKTVSVNVSSDQRISSQRLGLVDRICKRLSLQKDSDDIVLNFVAPNPGDRNEAQSIVDVVHKKKRSHLTHLQQDHREEGLRDFTEQRSSTPKQETSKSILRHPVVISSGNTKSKVPENKSTQNNKRCTSGEPGVTERPKVSFGPYVEKYKPLFQKQKLKESKQTSRVAKGHFTPNPDQSHHLGSSLSNIQPPSPRRSGMTLSNPSNPVLHPPRLTYSSFQKTEEVCGLTQQVGKMKKKGSYRKPLEMLLNLVDKHWRGEKSLHQNNNFLAQAVQILSMMESNISSREAEVKTLRREVDTLSSQAAAQEEQLKTEVRYLASQLEEAQATVGRLNEQLRIVLEENVSLQKQLIKLEKLYLKSMMKYSPLTQIKEAQTEVEDLKKEIEVLKEKVHNKESLEMLSRLQKSHRSSVVTSECSQTEMN